MKTQLRISFVLRERIKGMGSGWKESQSGYLHLPGLRKPLRMAELLFFTPLFMGSRVPPLERSD
ncbi:rCG27479 [Rattus norvegicus]|uniref:RCG27479 n=1 Tax=Rattus norvegicus TaxID=10116 RepID=A6K7A9_RAT|nr:rCG27479 [Rattus norvegicus]